MGLSIGIGIVSTRRRVVAVTIASCVAACGVGCRSSSEGVASQASARDEVAELDWKQALDEMGAGAHGQYSYVVYFPQDAQNNPLPAAYGISLRIGLANEFAACPSPGESTATPGWWLTVVTNGLAAGEYSYEWSRSYALSATEAARFDVSFEGRASDGEVKRYQALSGTAKIETSVVEFVAADDAQPISGKLTLQFPDPAVWEVECRQAFSAEAGVVDVGCDCLIDDQEVQSCVPSVAGEICCEKAVSGVVTYEIPFEARPCASLCTSTDFGGVSLCSSLEASDFDNW